MRVAGTGHRPQRLGLGYDEEARTLLVAFAMDCLQSLDNVTHVISGMAQGWDQALAEAALSLGLPLTAAVPFKGVETRWPDDSRRRYHDILSKAATTHYVSEPGYEKRKFAARDLWMVQNADALLALYDGAGDSGTALTVGMADEMGKPVYHVWEKWIRYEA